MTVLTRTIGIDPLDPDKAVLRDACRILRDGGLVAFPTDTLYALGADALNERAVRRVIEAKGRVADKPIPVLIVDETMATDLVAELPRAFLRLAPRFWPGPLTLVLKASPRLPSGLTAGAGTVGIRVPGSALARILIEAYGGPLTGTSANLASGEDPRVAGDVLRGLQGRIELLLDGGPVPLGLPSTILDLTREPAVLLREGALPSIELFRALEG